jgi:hypothetical protein
VAETKGFDSVVWSGGADSTMALTIKATNTTELWPVHALTVWDHPQLDKTHLKNQRLAMGRYLRWAKKKGYHIKHFAIEIQHGGIDVNGIAPATVGDGGQSIVWLSHLAPYFQANAEVHFGYVRWRSRVATDA